MVERTSNFAKELEDLIAKGEHLDMSLRYQFNKKRFERQLEELYEGDPEKIEEWKRDLPNFRGEYQTWYSKAQALVKQVLPDRLDDFVSYYEYPRVRKKIDFQNYMIRDYLQGLAITRQGGSEVVVDGSAAIPEFGQQLNIVKAARDALDSVLTDLKSILQADLFDTEIDSAAALSKAGYKRAAGAICGVVIEKHLLHICEMHGKRSRKKSPGISDLNQLLRDGDLITVPQWRFIQHLADIRNICDHAKGREPTKDEIDELVEGTQRVLKTVF